VIGPNDGVDGASVGVLLGDGIDGDAADVAADTDGMLVDGNDDDDDDTPVVVGANVTIRFISGASRSGDDGDDDDTVVDVVVVIKADADDGTGASVNILA
jgi:hypothetical protein